MIGFIYRLIVGRFHRCEHVWTKEDTVLIGDQDGNVIGRKFILQCTKCGNIKAVRT